MIISSEHIPICLCSPREIIEVEVREDNEEEHETTESITEEEEQIEETTYIAGEHEMETADSSYDPPPGVKTPVRMKPFVCEICHNGFRTKYKLKNHLIRQHKLPFETKSIKPGPDNKYVCNYCGRELKTVGSYITHLRTHTKKPFRCSVCHEGFRTVQKKKHHEFTCFQIAATGNKKVPCLTCNVWFTSPDELLDHKKKAHSSLQQPSIKRMESTCVKKTIANE